MIIDTHCHLDLYKNPLEVAKRNEHEGIITIGMTNLPSHFEMGHPHLLGYRKIRLALGMHPLFAEFHEKEFPLFIKNLHKTSYIGEVGLDFSREGVPTKDIQLRTFSKILNEIKGKKKVLSIHSRKAEKEILNLLITNDITLAIFHWYSGSGSLIGSMINTGYYFSVNPAMIMSKSGQEIIRKIPFDKILTESDGPFIKVDNRTVTSLDIPLVIQYLSKLWGYSYERAEEQIRINFNFLLSKLT